MAGPQPEVGKRGRISGLLARSDLNGKLGDVIRWIPTRNQWAIVVVDTKEKVGVRKDNIDFDYTDPSLECLGAAEKAAAAKALQEAEDVQLAAAIAASLAVSEHPVARVKRWGDGLEAPAAGSRHFVPQGFELKLDVPEAIECFGHSKSHVGKIMDAGRAKASKSPTPLAPKHAAALFAYTEETPLYGTLNYTMRTPHTPSTPTDTELKHYADYIVHTEAALSSLPTHVSEMQGKVYRGIKVLLNPDIYAPGKQITWQGFSSSTKKQMATLDFLTVLPGRKLNGSLFVIDSITAKDIRHFSAIPSEEEVLFPPNSQFKVEKVVTSEPEKKALLNQLGAYDMTDLDVYVLKQMA